MNGQVTIYALKNRLGKILYIGRTLDPYTRSQTHSFCYPTLKLVPLRTCAPQSAVAIEKKTIRKFKAIGQATLNKNTGEVGEGIRNGTLVPITAIISKDKRRALRSKLAGRGESVQDWLERMIDREIKPLKCERQIRREMQKTN